MHVFIKPHNTRNNMECLSQRKHYDFDLIENFIRCKGYPERIGGRAEKSNFRKGTYTQTFFFFASTIQFC